MRAECGWMMLALAAACGPHEPGHDAKTPGELLGTYAVSGRIARDDCGAELLGAANPWRFQIKLSRFQHDLYWLNGREAIVGDLDKDGTTFHFDTRVDVTVSAPARGKGGCIVSRRDRADGKLLAKADEISGLSADLRFEYSAKSDSECLEIIGITGGVQHLPCAIAYELTGELTGAGD